MSKEPTIFSFQTKPVVVFECFCFQFKTTTEILFRMVGKIVEQLLFFSFQNRTNLENLKKKKGNLSFSTKWPGVNWAFRDSSEVVEAQHTWFTTAYETILFNNNRSAAKWRIEHKIIKYVCERFKKTKKQKNNSLAWFGPAWELFYFPFCFQTFRGKKMKGVKKKTQKFYFVSFFFSTRKKVHTVQVRRSLPTGSLARSGERRVRWREEPHHHTVGLYKQSS